MKPARLRVHAGMVSLAFACLSVIHVFAQTGDIERVHDPRIAACEGKYYVFSTGGGIRIRRSADLIHWERLGTVFEQVPAWSKKHVPEATGLWAPDISFFSGTYHLYYSVSTFGKNRSVIGLATNKTLDPNSKEYRWEDHGKVIESTPGVDDWNAIDPAVCFDEKQHPWLAWGSFWGGIKLQPLDATTGGLLAGSKMTPIARRPSPDAIEAPSILRHGEWFYLFVSFDYCCKGVNSTYKLMVGRSRSINGPYLDRQGKSMLEGGGSVVLESNGPVRGPGHGGIFADRGKEYLIHHYYDARNRGIAAMQIREVVWTEDLWPTAAKTIDQTRDPKDER